VAIILAVSLVTWGAVGCNVPSSEPSSPTSCSADRWEANDTVETAREIPEMTDDPDSSRDAVGLTVHKTDDEDWFKVHVRDTGLGGNPVVSVAVSSDDFEVQTWFVCDDGHRGETECQYGAETYETPGDALRWVKGCTGRELEPTTAPDGTTQLDSGVVATSVTECTGTSSDNGTLFVRVRQRSSFQRSSLACSYGLSIDVR
jgi:hypothetical protein